MHLDLRVTLPAREHLQVRAGRAVPTSMWGMLGQPGTKRAAEGVRGLGGEQVWNIFVRVFIASAMQSGSPGRCWCGWKGDEPSSPLRELWPLGVVRPTYRAAAAPDLGSSRC